jgi:hypothetical protein
VARTGLQRMTETEWLECISPAEMLAYLGEAASPRKLRLFACACVRRIWPLLNDEHLRLAVKTAERFADGRVAAKTLVKTRDIVKRLSVNSILRQAVEALLPQEGPILLKPRDIRDPLDVISATRTVRAAARAIEARNEEDAAAPVEPIRRLASLDAVDLMREIFGNPFRPATLDPNWLTWKESVVPRMAQVIYRKRCFRNVPLLADALEEAGCGDAELLAHCREPVEHVRGCWVVDALLKMA